MNVKYSLDIYQKQAVYAAEKNILVTASPGAGKTTVIINRLNYLIEEKKININNIIVITFTKAAAENMKTRYKNINLEKAYPFFGTFHGLFYRMLRNYYGAIEIINERVKYKVIQDILRRYLGQISDEVIKQVINYISIFKTSNAIIEDFNLNIDKKIFMYCYEGYENYKKEFNILDFDDLPLKVKEILESNLSLLNKYRAQFQHILVDEFQDSDNLQLSILKLLNKDNSIYAVGDEDQSIYGFRGSNPECMIKFNNYFNNSKCYNLPTNYRSTKNIVDLSKKLILYNVKRNNKNIIACKQGIGNISYTNALDEVIQTQELIMNIKELIKQNFSYEDIAILFRTNIENRSLIDAFIKNDIPFKLLDKEFDFFEHFICKDIISYLKLSEDFTDKESFINIINKPLRYISKTKISTLKNDYLKKDCFEEFMHNMELSISQMKEVDKIKRNCIKMKNIKPYDATNIILNSLGYLEYLMEYSQKFKVSFEDIMETIEEFKQSTYGFENINDFLIHLEKVKQKTNMKEINKKSVTLSTIHGVKGMEFKNVFIINCVEGSIPHKSNLETNMEEERRLFYVAVTRAIENLFIFNSSTLKGKAVEESRFIKECGIC